MTLHDVKAEIKKQLDEKTIDPKEAVKKFEVEMRASSGRVFRPNDAARRLQQYERDEALRVQALSAQVPFIHRDTELFLYPGLVLIGGVSGQGKSTLASNLLAGFLPYSTKQAVVVTNEESLGAIYNRVGCILNGVSFNAYHKNQLNPRVANEVRRAARDTMERIIVVDDDGWDMSVLEDVTAVLEYSAKADIGLVIIDYHQTINQSRQEPTSEAYAVLKKLGFYLKDYARKVAIPVLNLVQLRNGEEEFKDRVEGDRTIYNHCQQAIEVIPDFEARNSKFVVVKDRFGSQQNREVIMDFVDGSFQARGEL